MPSHRSFPVVGPSARLTGSCGQTSTEFLVISGVIAAILIAVLMGFRGQVGTAIGILGRCMSAAAGGSTAGCTTGGAGGAAGSTTTPGKAASATPTSGSFDPVKEQQVIKNVIKAATAPAGPAGNWQEAVTEAWANILSPGRVQLQQQNMQTGDQWFNRGWDAIRRAEAALAEGREDDYRRAMAEARQAFGRASTFYGLAESDKAQLAEQAMNEIKETVYDPARSVIKNFGFVLPKPLQNALDRTFGALDIVLDGEMKGWDQVAKDKAKEYIMSRLADTKFDKLGGKSMNDIMKDAKDIAKDKAYSNDALRKLQEQLTGNPEYVKEMEKVVGDLTKEVKEAREAAQEAIRNQVNKRPGGN